MFIYTYIIYFFDCTNNLDFDGDSDEAGIIPETLNLIFLLDFNILFNETDIVWHVLISLWCLNN